MLEETSVRLAPVLQLEPETRLKRPFLKRYIDSPLYPLSAVVIALLFWQFVLARGLVPGIPTKFLGSPAGIFVAFITLATHGYGGAPLWEHVLASVARTLTGFFIAAVVAVPFGLLMGYARPVGNLFIPIFSFLRPIPALAFIPVMTIWFGIGETAKIAVIAITAFLFTVLGASLGVRTVPREYTRVAQNFNISPARTLLSIVLPAAMPQILIGLRTGMALSWAVVVAAELIAAQRGLGFIIMDASTLFHIDVVYVGITIIGVIGIALDLGFRLVENRLMHWVAK
ncbi:MAG: ABC transporter permease [Candidatus Velthaea sp.]